MMKVRSRDHDAFFNSFQDRLNFNESEASWKWRSWMRIFPNLVVSFVVHEMQSDVLVRDANGCIKEGVGESRVAETQTIGLALEDRPVESLVEKFYRFTIVDRHI